MAAAAGQEIVMEELLAIGREAAQRIVDLGAAENPFRAGLELPFANRAWFAEVSMAKQMSCYILPMTDPYVTDPQGA